MIQTRTRYYSSWKPGHVTVLYAVYIYSHGEHLSALVFVRKLFN
jgi:hypothetical protein